MPLSVTIHEKDNGVCSVCPVGSVDTDTYQKLEESLENVKARPFRAVILDLQRVSYISSIGLRVIMWAERALTAEGKRFVLIGLVPAVRKVFDTMKLLPLYSVFSDMQEADRYLDTLIKKKTQQGT